MKKGEIWLLRFPSKSGREQEGKRPAILIRDSKVGMIICIPLTSNLSATSFPFTFKIQHSNENKLEKDSVALVFQIQSLDKRRVIMKIGELEKENLNVLDNILKEMLQL